MSVRLAARGLAFAAAACLTLAAGRARADVTLLFWPGPESQAMQKVIDAFNAGPGKTDGFAVKQLLFSRTGYFDKELADLAAGSKDFDLALVTTYTLGRYVPFLSPVGDYVSAAAQQAYAPAALDSLKSDGALYGVPTDISVHFLYYRTDLIDRLLKDAAWQKEYAAIAKARLGETMTPKPPADWHWDDYVATSLFFTKSLNQASPVRYGTVLQLKNLIFNVMLWDDTLVADGGNWLTAAGKPEIDSAPTMKAVRTYLTIIQDHATPPGSIDYEFPEANQAFGSGQVATMLQWNAAYAIVNDPKQMPMTAGHVGIAPMPAGPAGHKTHLHSLGIGLNKASTHKQQAGMFLTYLATEPAMEIYAKAGGTPPMPAVLQGMAATHPDFALVAKEAAQDGYVIRGGTASTAMAIYTLLAEKLSAIWSGQVFPADGLKSVQQGMASVLKP
ncbi:MAG TPA: extracellular solute-binding protein [Acetobacteraceae bacterium]|nr:extracellular solute-binding protein [Acetobacteraceae bacterium]